MPPLKVYVSPDPLSVPPYVYGNSYSLICSVVLSLRNRSYAIVFHYYAIFTVIMLNLGMLGLLSDLSAQFTGLKKVYLLKWFFRSENGQLFGTTYQVNLATSVVRCIVLFCCCVLLPILVFVFGVCCVCFGRFAVLFIEFSYSAHAHRQV